MKLHGTIDANLQAAIASARRLRDHPVHADTVQHWRDLLHQARRQLAATPPEQAEATVKLVTELEDELAERCV